MKVFKNKIKKMTENYVPSLSIICPCYNEMETIIPSIKSLSKVLNELGNKKLINLNDSIILIVDDGSTDNSWSVLKKIADEQKHIKLIKLSKNFGHQNALLAGLMNSNQDITITIDIDLQDDIRVIESMVLEYLDGFEIVYGIKQNRSADGFLKKIFAKLFYKLLKIFGANVITNHADFRLLSSKVVSALRNHKEYNIYLRGIIPLLGFRSTSIKYDLKKREFGAPQYNYKKSLSLALNGITSFSLVPLRLIFILGFFVAIISASLTLFYLFQAIFNENLMPGWASTVLPIYFLGSIQLIAIGVISEYIGKLFLESKKRPNYIIEESVE